jgi:hypothetical protein
LRPLDRAAFFGARRRAAAWSLMSSKLQKCVGLCHLRDTTPAPAARIRGRSIIGRDIRDSVATSHWANSLAQASDPASGAIAAFSAKSSNAATSSS